MNRGVEIERALLGGCLLEDEQTLDLFCSNVLPDHFSLDSHRRIARRVLQLHSAEIPVTELTVLEELRKHKELDAVGGWSYVADLTMGLPRNPANSAQEHINRLKEFWRLRQLAVLGEQMAQGASDGVADSHSLIQSAAERLEAIACETCEEQEDAASLTMKALDSWDAERDAEGGGLLFGIPQLDDLVKMKHGQQTALGASSGVGKTTLLAQILYANHESPCHAFLLEPTREEVLRKLWSIEGNVRYTAAVNPKLANIAERQALRDAAFRVAEWPLRLNDQANLTLDRVLSLGKLSIHRYGTRLIAVDYIQRLKVKAAENGESVRLRIARASTALADLVKNTGCHSLLLSQLTTGRKNGAQAKPTMYDFRESSQIENDAHTIILLHRNYDEDQGHYTDEGAILVPKVRFGTPCNLRAQFDGRMAIWKGVN